MVYHAYLASPQHLDTEDAADVLTPEARKSRRHPLTAWAQRICEGLKVGIYRLLDIFRGPESTIRISTFTVQDIVFLAIPIRFHSLLVIVFAPLRSPIISVRTLA